MAEPAAAIAAPAAAAQWQTLSPWSVFHFAARAIVKNIQAAYFFAPATYGVAQTDLAEYAWTIPIGIIVLVLISSVVTYVFFSYRVIEDAIEVRRGALFKKHLNLAFTRIQNINTEHPFYFRPLGLVTLKIDSAGSAGEEIYLAALDTRGAEALRAYIAGRRRELGPRAQGTEQAARDEERICFTRSLFDLVVHGLTNNRSLLVIAAIGGLMWQANVSLADLVAALGLDLDVVVAGLSVVRLVLLFVVSFVFVMGVVALLSILVAIVTYYGFTIYRTEGDLIVKRGLFTKHEIQVRKSRIQTVSIRQDWLDFLIGRCNVVLEQISHRARDPGDEWNALRKKIVVPSVRIEETPALASEVLPARVIEALPFTPIRKRYFYKHALIASAGYALVLLVPLFMPELARLYVPLVLTLWPAHVAAAYMRWKRGGLAIDGDTVVARSGLIGVDYHLFPAFKVQDVAHVQSVLMRRRGVSNIVFRTASSTIKVPYLPTAFAKAVVDYCIYRVEAGEKSWM